MDDLFGVNNSLNRSFFYFCLKFQEKLLENYQRLPEKYSGTYHIKGSQNQRLEQRGDVECYQGQRPSFSPGESTTSTLLTLVELQRDSQKAFVNPRHQHSNAFCNNILLCHYSKSKSVTE